MNYWEDGYVLLEGAVPSYALERYIAGRVHLSPQDGDFDSYLPSRDDYENPDVSAVFSHLDSAVRDISPDFKPMLAEARLRSSRIFWHRDCNLNSTEAGDSYCGAIIAIEDMEPGSGAFEYIPGSHLWQVDTKIINEVNIRTKQNECFDYYRALVENKNPQILSFGHRAGDALIWHGHLLHRGAEPTDRFSKRHSMTIHYSKR